ncbi:MAG: nucleoside:proton symporter [Pseudobacteriovorax sp.]|nr:nucleoside:proton symporter [Pseudobacteriovorax sp.]
MSGFQSLFGLLIFFGFVFLLSERKRAVPWKVVGIGLVLQVVGALSLLYIPGMSSIFRFLNDGVVALNAATLEATQFMFGYLAGGAAPFAVENAANNFLVAFQILPLIIVIGSLSALLFHLGVIPKMIELFSLILEKTLGVSGALGFGASASIFLGTIEAPLAIKPHIAKLSRSELFALICASMATVAGTVMALYASILSQVFEDSMAMLIIASLMSVPAAIILAQIWIPPESGEKPKVNKYRSPYSSSLMAVLEGTLDATRMIVQITVIIIVLFAFVNLVNRGLSLAGPDLTIQWLLGSALRPVMWLTGIPWSETITAGQLMATKIVLNEFVAYLSLSQVEPGLLSDHSKVVLTYSMCGFASITSVGIVVGGLSYINPERKSEIATLGLKSLLVGNLATLTTGALINLIT